MAGAAELDQDTLEQARREVAEYGRRMLDDGLVSGTSGNISVRLSDETILITPSGVRYELIEPSDICALDGEGGLLAGSPVPSSETPLHLAVYRATDARAVVHTHSMYATAVACTMRALPAVHYAIFRFGGDSVAVTDYKRFGSDELAESAVEGLVERTAVLLGNHGAVTRGASLAEAYELAVLLEWLAELYWRASALGEPRILGREDVEAVAAEATQRRYMRAQAGQ